MLRKISLAIHKFIIGLPTNKDKEAINILKVAVDFGMATIWPLDGLFYFEKLKAREAAKEKDISHPAPVLSE